jgi:hypothetical protein
MPERAGDRITFGGLLFFWPQLVEAQVLSIGEIRTAKDAKIMRAGAELIARAGGCAC